jgi:hypothetical protein
MESDGRQVLIINADPMDNPSNDHPMPAMVDPNKALLCSGLFNAADNRIPELNNGRFTAAVFVTLMNMYLAAQVPRTDASQKASNLVRL